MLLALLCLLAAKPTVPRLLAPPLQSQWPGQAGWWVNHSGMTPMIIFTLGIILPLCMLPSMRQVSFGSKVPGTPAAVHASRAAAVHAAISAPGTPD